MMWWFAVLTVLATAQAATHLGAHFKLQPFGRARQQDERYRYVTAVSQYSSKGNSKLTQADARSIKQEHSSANKAGPGGGSADADGSCPCSDKKLCAYISKDKTPEVHALSSVA